jgi:tRNA threonylcarbamoyladenosine biosynthesis protein TsaB
MTILAIETTADLCSLAIRSSGKIVVERSFRHRMHLSERLVGDVQSVLEDAEVEPDEIDAFAVGVGPGSFTGVRIGVTTVKTWADLFAKPVVGVTSLDALGEEFAFEPDSLVVPIVRARPGMVYSATYLRGIGVFNQVDPPELLELDDVIQRLAKRRETRTTVCGDGWEKNCKELRARLAELKIDVITAPIPAPRASTIAAIAESRVQGGQTVSAIDLVPFYLSAPPIDPRVEARMAAS